MRRAMIVACLLLIASPAGAVTYRWEDGKGVHYSDEFASVPEELRKRSVPEDQDGVIDFGRIMTLRNDTGAARRKLEEIERDNTERDRIVMEAIRQHQADVINRMNRESSALQKGLVTMFAGKKVLWIVPLLLVASVWLLSLRDIRGRVFPSPAFRYLWLACVLFLPLIGSVLYYRFGRPPRKTADGNAGEHGNMPGGNAPAR